VHKPKAKKLFLINFVVKVEFLVDLQTYADQYHIDNVPFRLASLNIIVSLICCIVCDCLLAVAATTGLVYVIGGWGGSTGRISCEVYDVSTKQWKPIADLNQGRSQTAACALDDGRIVAVGGCDAWNSTNTVEIYDPATNRWSYLPSMAMARRGSGVVFLKSMLAIGNYCRN